MQLIRMFLYALGALIWSLCTVGFSIYGMKCLQDNPEELIFAVLSFIGMFLCYPYLFYCGKMVVYLGRGGIQ